MYQCYTSFFFAIQIKIPAKESNSQDQIEQSIFPENPEFDHTDQINDLKEDNHGLHGNKNMRCDLVIEDVLWNLVGFLISQNEKPDGMRVDN